MCICVYTHINIYTYTYLETRGLQEVCKKLLQDDKMVIPILCNQEKFLLKANGYMIEHALHGYHILFKPAEEEFLDGRPKNGMFIAIHYCCYLSKTQFHY